MPGAGVSEEPFKALESQPARHIAGPIDDRFWGSISRIISTFVLRNPVLARRRCAAIGLMPAIRDTGTTKLHRLEESIGAANVELTSEDLRQIENAAAKITVHGERYPAHLQARVGR